jgi:hypothetical protein
VRIKYGFVKVYAVGTYLDPLAMSEMKGQPQRCGSEGIVEPQVSKDHSHRHGSWFVNSQVYRCIERKP